MIWWVASYPKSGNTWVRMFLTACRNGGQVNINQPVLAAINDCVEYFYQVVSPKPIFDLTQFEVLALRPAMLMHLVEAAGGTQVIIKTHIPAVDIEGIFTIPKHLTKGAIYLVRDPRDVVVSMAAHNNSSIDDAITCMGNEKHALGSPIFTPIGTWSQNVQCWQTAGDINTLMLRYEDMVENPAAVFKLILNHIGMKVSEEVFQAALRSTSFGALRAQEDKNGFRERKGDQPFFRSGVSGDWRNHLSADQANRIVDQHGDVMERLMYSTHHLKRSDAA